MDAQGQGPEPSDDVVHAPNALIVHPDGLYVRINDSTGRAFAHAYPISCSDLWHVRSYPGGPTVSMPWAGVEAAMVSAAIQVVRGGGR